MLFYPVGESGLWEVLVRWDDPRSLTLTQDGIRSFRLVSMSPDDIGADEFVTEPFSRDGFAQTLRVFFRPHDSLNPNLDGSVYEVRAAGQLLVRKAPRVNAPEAGAACFDFRSSPRLHGFAQAFWRDRANQLHPIDQPGKTAINLGIAQCGAGSQYDSLYNSGWPVTDCLMDADFMLRGMHALSVGATRMSAQYPQLLRTHHWAQIDAVIPGAAYFTLLRDPIRRLVSHYCFCRDHGWMPDDMETHLDKVCGGGAYNTQLGWLGFLGGPLPWSLLPDPIIPDHFQDSPGGKVQSQTLLGFAQSALSKFFFIGMNDYFDESLCLGALLMRSPTVGRWRMLHRSSASDGFTLSARTRARLERFLGPEIEFYEKRRAEFLTEYAEDLRFLKTHVGSLLIG